MGWSGEGSDEGASQLPPESPVPDTWTPNSTGFGVWVSLTLRHRGPLTCSFSLEARGPPSEASSPPLRAGLRDKVCALEEGAGLVTRCQDLD